MLVLLVSKILCSVMNLTVAIMYSISAKSSQTKDYERSCCTYDDVVCFLVVLDSVFETLAQRNCPQRWVPPWVDRVYDRKSVPFFCILNHLNLAFIGCCINPQGCPHLTFHQPKLKKLQFSQYLDTKLGETPNKYS